MTTMTILVGDQIDLITVADPEEVKDDKNYYENFNDCNKIILKKVAEDKLLGSLTLTP